MLDRAQIEAYGRDGFLVLRGLLSAAEIGRLRARADAFVAGAKGVAAHDAVYDLEDSHTPESPRVRRIKTPHLHHPDFAATATHPGIVGALIDLWGPNIRFDSSKLNMKSAGYGAPVEWHQDWAFYPHTNDDLAAVGVMLDDCDAENGPMLMIPGSHKGPLLDHHEGGFFCGAVDPRAAGVDLSRAVALTGKAGDVTIHHVRTLHGSAANVSGKQRRLYLLMYRAADAWPLLGFPEGLARYDSMMIAGAPSIEPRLAPVPVRLPLPVAGGQGSIYETQKSASRRFFADIPAETRARRHAT
jgi:phytanoyl-CoA hydroxylase